MLALPNVRLQHDSVELQSHIAHPHIILAGVQQRIAGLQGFPAHQHYGKARMQRRCAHLQEFDSHLQFSLVSEQSENVGLHSMMHAYNRS